MHVNVGPFRYQVQLVRGYIRYEGEECLGLCDNLAQRILISDVPPETQRVQVFFHELMHAWWYHFGVDCEDEEQVVDLVGVAMTDFLIQAVRTMRQAAMVTDAASMGPGVSAGANRGPNPGAYPGASDGDGDDDATGLTDGPMPVLRIQRGGAVRPRRRAAPPPYPRPRRPLSHLGDRPPTRFTPDPMPGSPAADDRWTIRIYDPTGVVTASVDRSASS